MSSDPGVDPALLAAEATVEVASRRAAGAYPPELLQQLATPLPRAEMQDAPELLAHIPSAHDLIGSGVLGQGKVALQRVIRRLLAWYVHPITVDQSRFNQAILGAVSRLEERLVRLEPVTSPLAIGDAPLNHDLDAARAVVLETLVRNDPAQSVLILGWGGGSAGSTHPFAQLKGASPDSLRGIYLGGIMPCLPARGMLDLAALAVSRLHRGGWLASDAPDGSNPVAPADPSSVVFGMTRWIAPTTIAFVMESVGLVQPQTHTVSAIAGGRAWFAVVAERPE